VQALISIVVPTIIQLLHHHTISWLQNYFKY